MSFWTFVFAISVAGMIFSYLIKRKELQYGVQPQPETWTQMVNFGGAEKGTLEAIEKKLEQMDRRLQSLETIVLERERHNEFDNALNG